MALAEDIAVALAAWPCPVDSVRPLGGGWNSSTWLVMTPDGRRFVAKLADHLDAEALAGGLRVAEFAAVRGLVCGDPLRTRDGELTVPLPEGFLLSGGDAGQDALIDWATMLRGPPCRRLSGMTT